jgi:hypothetical protein
MMSLYTTELIINTITLLIAYLITETCAGFFRAWVATKFGDPTPQHLGYLTLNPLAHLDPIGIATLVLFGLGWGAYVPIDYRAMRPPYYTLKVIAAYFSGSIAHLFILLVALTLLIKMFSIQVLYLIGPMILSGSISFSLFTNLYTQTA